MREIPHLLLLISAGTDHDAQGTASFFTKELYAGTSEAPCLCFRLRRMRGRAEVALGSTKDSVRRHYGALVNEEHVRLYVGR